ncbi:MAG: HD domain-containing protein [Candidatus Woesearchaeota archaeon]
MEKTAMPTKHFKGKDLPVFLKSYLEYGHLKNVYRKGWLRHISERYVESVADHSWSVAILAFILAKEYKPDLDADKILKLGVFHELGEAYAGDQNVIHDNISVEKKNAQEREGVLNIVEGLKARAEIIEAWEEIEELKTPEGRFVKDVDRLEMCMWALAYEHEHKKCLDEFYEYARERIKDVAILALLDEIESFRPHKS